MDKSLRIAVVLSAYDRMTRTVNDAVNRSTAKLDELKKKSMNLFGTGAAQVAAGSGILYSLTPAVTAFAELEDSATRLKSVMMKSGGVLPADQFKKVNDLAIGLGNELPGTTSDFQNMFATMIRGGVTTENILGGTGRAAALLAVQLQLPYEEAARGTAKLKEATGVADSEMMGFMDTISRLDNVGVKFDEMQFAFSRSAGQLKFLKVQGLEATNQLAALYATLIKGGASGETVGTGMSTAFSNLFDRKKMAEANAAAKKLGITFEFIDKAGNFKGVENFVKQLDQLKGKSEQQISDVLAPLFGATGQDSQFIKSIAQGGLAGYEEMRKRMADQASLQEKVTMQLGTLKNMWDAATGTFTNFLAAFGEAIGPELKALTKFFGDLSATVQDFTANNPRLAKFFAIMIAGAGVLMVVIGVINLVRAAVMAMNLALLMNPFVLIAAAAVAAIALIYTYWEPIKGFFADLWEGVKSVTADAVFALVEMMIYPMQIMEKMINKAKEITGVGTSTSFTDPTMIREKIHAAMGSNMYGAKAPTPAPAPAPVPNGSATPGTQLNYQPSVTIQGSASPADKDAIKKMMDDHGVDMMRRLEDINKRNDFKKF